ncbi:MAG TPA: lytic murein transglycosylase [Solirubrobacteraceae bacterium]|nr:lytic murein transglycosylase [Solirubrobacteraceae bacterium]
MNKRKLLTSLAVAGALAAGLGGSVIPAGAATRTYLVTLVTGQQLTVELPAGTSPGSLSLPGISTPVASIQDITPPEQAPAPAAPGDPPASPETPAPGAPAPGQQEGGSTEPGAEDAEGSTGEEEEDDAEGGGRGDSEGRPGRGRTADPRRDRAPEQRPRGRDRSSSPPQREPGGAPTPANPSFSLAQPGPAPIGVPNFFIDKFRIPPFLLPIYQAAGIEYGVRWEVLAAINEIETDYGRNLNVSSAGALGWMQFMPATWKQYGVDANGDKKKDPYNPVDASFAAARYLRAAGAEDDLRKAIFAYNHADWYVNSVLMRARLIAGLPPAFVGALSGLTEGIFPVAAQARYADDLSEEATNRRVARGRNAAVPVESETDRRGIRIYAKPGSRLTAVQDGEVVRVGESARLGRFVQLRDVFGNTDISAHLGKVAKQVAVPKAPKGGEDDVVDDPEPPRDPRPTAPASAGTQRPAAREPSGDPTPREPGAARESSPRALAKQRLFANPQRPRAYEAGGREQLLNTATALPGNVELDEYFTLRYGLSREDVELRPLRKGTRVIAGTVLGRVGQAPAGADSNVLFEIRPAGRGAPRIDPKPILDGWKLLETSATYRAEGRNPFFGPDAKKATVGQILLMSKTQLQRRVLRDPRVEIHPCGRQDVRGGRIDRRVLASLAFLSASGLRPTVTSLRCGRETTLTASGNVSHHSSGNAVDIARVNGKPILGNQGKGSITDIAVRRLLTLQGTMKPAQIITLMRYEGTDNTYAMGDHADHIHVGFRPQYDPNTPEGRRMESVLKPGQWIKLLDRLNDIDNPTVRTRPSNEAIDVGPRRRDGDD